MKCCAKLHQLECEVVFVLQMLLIRIQVIKLVHTNIILFCRFRYYLTILKMYLDHFSVISILQLPFCYFKESIIKYGEVLCIIISAWTCISIRFSNAAYKYTNDSASTVRFNINLQIEITFDYFVFSSRSFSGLYNTSPHFLLFQENYDRVWWSVVQKYISLNVK